MAHGVLSLEVRLHTRALRRELLRGDVLGAVAVATCDETASATADTVGGVVRTSYVTGVSY